MGAGDAGPKSAFELINRRVPGTPLEIRIPTTWTIDDVDPGPAPEPPAKDAGPSKARQRIELRTRTMLSARAPEGGIDGAAKPWLQVLHDPYLPAGTTSSEYLDAQRAANAAVTKLEHVEAERSRRQGRPSYHVRDEWDAPFGAKTVRLSQEALLLLDAKDDALHGYAVVVTLLKDDYDAMEGVLRQIFESVRFAEE